jgi:hypothetical protein
MNEFTKEELQIIYEILYEACENGREPDLVYNLKDKIKKIMTIAARTDND